MNTCIQVVRRGHSKLALQEPTRSVMRLTMFCAVACALMTTVGVAGAMADTYTLDGKPASDQNALKGGLGGGCSVVPSLGGTYDCFSSLDSRTAAIGEAMKQGKVPPGSTAIPPRSAAAAIAKAKKHYAHVATCNGDTNLHVDTYQHNTWGFMEYVPNWITFGPKFNNTISSDTTSSYYNAYYHDGDGGTGHFFDQAASNCHVDNDLGLDAFPGGGSWDNKFSSGQDL